MSTRYSDAKQWYQDAKKARTEHKVKVSYADALAEELRTPPGILKLTSLFFFTASITFFSLGSIASVFNDLAFTGPGWVVTQIFLGLTILANAFAVNRSIRWLTGFRARQHPHGMGPGAVLIVGLLVGLFFSVWWAVALNHGELPGRGYKTFELLGLLYVIVILLFLVQPSKAREIVTSESIVSFLPQTAGTVLIDLPRTGRTETFLILKQVEGGYRYIERGGGHTHDLASGGLCLLNPAFRLNWLSDYDSGKLPPVHTNLFEVQPVLGARLPMRPDIILTESGVNRVIDWLFLQQSTSSLVPCIKTAVEKIAGQYANKADVMRRDYRLEQNRAALARRKRKYEEFGSQLDDLHSIMADLDDAIEAQELAEPYQKALSQIDALETNGWSEFRSQVRQAFRALLTREVTQEAPTTKDDLETIEVMLDACGLNLDFTVEWTPAAQENKKFIETEVQKWTPQKEEKARERFLQIVEGLLKDTSSWAHLCGGRSQSAICNDLLNIMASGKRGNTKDLKQTFLNLFGPDSPTARVASASSAGEPT